MTRRICPLSREAGEGREGALGGFRSRNCRRARHWGAGLFVAGGGNNAKQRFRDFKGQFLGQQRIAERARPALRQSHETGVAGD